MSRPKCVKSLVEDQTGKLEITDASFVLSTNNTFTETFQIRVTTSSGTQTVPVPCGGTYTRSGNNITFTETSSSDFCGGTYSGTWDGNKGLTVTFDADDIAVYTK